MISEDYTRMYLKQISIIKDCKGLMSGLGENEAAIEMDNILAELNQINEQKQRAASALASLPSPQTTTQQTCEELFESALKSISLEKIKRHNAHSESSEEEELGDRSLIVSQVAGVPTDPITKLKIKVPARNQVCNHVYEYDVIMSYILRAKKKRKGVKCPHIGCTNAKLQENHIVKDAELRKKLVSMLSTEEVDVDDSIIDAL